MDNWLFNRSVTRILLKNNIDIYEAHAVSGYHIAKMLQKHKVSKPFIHIVHGVLADEYLNSFKLEPLNPRNSFTKLFMLHLSKCEKEIAEKATLIVTVSQYSLENINRFYGIEKEKIRVVPNGVDIQRFSPPKKSNNKIEKIKSEIKLKTDEKCILFVGNLIPRKGLPLLVDAATNLLKETKRFKIVIVGDGPSRRKIIRYAKKRAVINHFIFLGRVDDKMLPDIYNCSDLVVLPSLQEGQGITILEAQATAKPVVACKVGGIPEIVIDGKTGILVRPNSFELANAILRLIMDEDLRRKMGENGRKFVCEKYTWEKCAIGMLNVYREALEICK